MVFQNHGHELNYGNLILKDKKYLGIIFIQIYYSQIFKKIWINKIRFGKSTSDILKRMWQQVSAAVETYRTISG
jgi:hypothetical protein